MVQKHVEDAGCNVYYGDSVTYDTPHTHHLTFKEQNGQLQTLEKFKKRKKCISETLKNACIKCKICKINR